MIHFYKPKLLLMVYRLTAVGGTASEGIKFRIDTLDPVGLIRRVLYSECNGKLHGQPEVKMGITDKSTRTL